MTMSQKTITVVMVRASLATLGFLLVSCASAFAGDKTTESSGSQVRTEYVMMEPCDIPGLPNAVPLGKCAQFKAALGIKDPAPITIAPIPANTAMEYCVLRNGQTVRMPHDECLHQDGQVGSTSAVVPAKRQTQEASALPTYSQTHAANDCDPNNKWFCGGNRAPRLFSSQQQQPSGGYSFGFGRSDRSGKYFYYNTWGQF